MRRRAKAYLERFSHLQPFRRSPKDDDHASETSPTLILVAVVLALLLAMLEVDLHSAELHSLGLMGADWTDTINP